jgi:hypothetical protein
LFQFYQKVIVGQIMPVFPGNSQGLIKEKFHLQKGTFFCSQKA